jgi:hypothetical protein
MNVDKEYWSTEFPSPYGPSEDDVLIFKQKCIKGKTLLLGCTKKLIPISDVQMDIDPWYNGTNVIIKDWLDNTDYYENIIGDGVFNLTKELTDDLLKMASKYCKVLVIRSFNYKFEKLRIASNFPTKDDFIITPTESKIFDDYSIYIWTFQTN